MPSSPCLAPPKAYMAHPVFVAAWAGLSTEQWRGRNSVPCCNVASPPNERCPNPPLPVPPSRSVGATIARPARSLVPMPTVSLLRWAVERGRRGQSCPLLLGGRAGGAGDTAGRIAESRRPAVRLKPPWLQFPDIVTSLRCSPLSSAHMFPLRAAGDLNRAGTRLRPSTPSPTHLTKHTTQPRSAHGRLKTLLH